MEMLSEHQCEGWLEGYLLTGRHGLFNCYEAFIHIVDSMFNQHAKWLKVTAHLPWRRKIASLNYLLASHVWRQDHNGFTHQDPGFIDHVVNKKAEIVRVYLPPDANCLLSVMDHCLRSRHYVNVVVAGKHPAPQWLTMDAAVKHCTQGIGIWQWASNDQAASPDVVMACCGDVPTLETLAAVSILREHLPELRIRVVNVVDLMKLQPPSEHPHGLSDRDFDELFTRDKPVIFAFHAYPWLIHRLTYRRTNHDNLHVRGYKEEGTITTPFDMTVLNELDRFHLVIDAIDRLPQTGDKGVYLKQQLKDKLIEHRQYINRTARTCRRCSTGAGMPAPAAPRQRHRPDVGSSKRAGSPRRRGSRVRAAPQQREQLVGVERLGQVQVEAGLAGTALIVVLAPAGHRDQQHAGAPVEGAQPARQLVAVQARHADVQHHHLGPFALGHGERLEAVAGDADGVPRKAQPGREALARVGVVFGDEDARARVRPSASHRPPRAPAAPPARGSGMYTVNSLPRPRPSLRASTRPPCSSTRPFTSARPMPSPPSERSSAARSCANIVKTLASAPGASPMPLSRTLIEQCPAAVRIRISTRPPGSVYLAALVSRFESTCERRTASAFSTILHPAPSRRRGGRGRRAAGAPSRARCATTSDEIGSARSSAAAGAG